MLSLRRSGWLPVVFILSLFTVFACSNGNNFRFTELDCNPDPMPAFDGNKVTLLDSNRNPFKDTIIGQIEKRRDVFKPCREMIYYAEFKSAEGEIITQGRIRMMATGKRWEHQPEKQDGIIVQYEFTESDFQKNRDHQLNKGLEVEKWMGECIEGVIENVEEIWMHPFRYNQYNFTEVAPFPEIKFPLRIGKKWSGNLKIDSGWGDWNGTNGSFQYEVLSRESVVTKYGEIDDCWRVKSKSRYTFGESHLEYWFNEELGFVRMEYQNYGNQTLAIDLEEVIER